MKIERLSLAEGASSARGVAVIIDVFRAFTCEPLLFHLGVARVVLQADPEQCRVMRATTPDVILIGEHNEEPLDGFDLTNSPSLIMGLGRTGLAGRTVAHRTTSGVTGATAASRSADAVFLAGFVNAKATVDAIKAMSPSIVGIVAMGIRSTSPAPEDERCGDYIESLLKGCPYDHATAIVEILAHESAQKFLRGDKEYLPAADPTFCLQRDILPYALRAAAFGGQLEALRVP